MQALQNELIALSSSLEKCQYPYKVFGQKENQIRKARTHYTKESSVVETLVKTLSPG